MEGKFFDLNRIPENGQIVLMLSMSRLFMGQNAKKIYEAILHFWSKATELSIDFYCIYTNGLYFNSSQSGLDIRRRTTNQMLQHVRELRSLILEDKKIPLKAVNFLVWDSLILSESSFLETQSSIYQLYDDDVNFRALVDMASKYEFGERQVRFVLEETVVTYLLRESLIPLPVLFSNTQAWRLLVYMGGPLLSDIYLSQFSKFRAKKEVPTWFHKACRHGMYDAEKRIFVDYTRVPLDLKPLELINVGV
jgi:hypothetical protein